VKREHHVRDTRSVIAAADASPSVVQPSTAEASSSGSLGA
jgi:hypothetical protein